MNWTEHHIRLPDTMCHSREKRGLTPLYVKIVLIVSTCSYRAMSLGGMKPNFIKHEKRIFKKPPLQKGRKEG